jgi:transcriptional regulator with XRE-family HTH domain
MSDHDMEIHLLTEIEVLERRLSSWVDKSRPEFRRMVQRRQLLQRELDTLREARRLRLEKRAIDAPVSATEPDKKPADQRDSFVLPILAKKGWSIHEWAVNAEVDFHTANDYLKGKTRPFRSTRVKLAESLGVTVDDLPK